MSEAHLASLLEIARETLREELLPGLAGERKFQAAMIANALAVAARSLEHGGVAAEQELAALRRLYGMAESGPHEAGEIGTLRRRLVQDIRRGRFDAVESSLLVDALRTRAALRLSVTNPSHVAAPRRL